MKRAVTAATDENWAGCLSALLDEWREQRQPELAELIERVSARVKVAGVAPSVPAIIERIETSTDSDIDVLIATIQSQMRTHPAAARCLLALAKVRQPDSRIAKALSELFMKSPYRGEEGRFDADVLDALDAIDDPRYRNMIVTAGPYAASRRARLHRKRPQIDHLIEVAGNVQVRKAPPPPTADLRAAITAIDEVLARPTRAHDPTALLDAIYADPANTPARMIYADMLQEAGDPRGEFITLQCARGPDEPPSRRERQLLKLYERAWLGELDPLVRKKDLVYRRGFVAQAALSDRGDPASVRAEWQTLETLDCSSRWQLGAWLPTLRSLTRIARLSVDDVVTLSRPVPWTTVGVRHATSENVATLFNSGVLPSLAMLDLSAVEPTPQLIRALSPFASRLAKLRVYAPPMMPTLAEHAFALGIPLELVREYELEPTVVVELGSEEVAFVYRAPTSLGYACAVAEHLPSRIRTARIEHPRPNPTELQMLKNILAAKRITISETRPASTARPAS